MTEKGGIPKDSPELQDEMVFRLNPLDLQKEEKKDDDPMWFPASSSPLDWFMEDE
ncbi:MAG TPA: hypothetical protein VEI96_02165 [Thermodesulfovibrionales bacterium]|nr:hypothetical protein [Thermodesulfovibrionales bacterium]